MADQQSDKSVPLSADAQDAKELMQQQLLRKMANKMMAEAIEEERQRRIKAELEPEDDTVRRKAFDQLIVVQEDLVRCLNRMKVFQLLCQLYRPSIPAIYNNMLELSLQKPAPAKAKYTGVVDSVDLSHTQITWVCPISQPCFQHSINQEGGREPGDMSENGSLHIFYSIYMQLASYQDYM